MEKFSTISATLTSQSFPSSIDEKLDDSNYHHWQQHDELIMKSLKLQQFVVNPVFPPRYLTENNHRVDCVNIEYEA